MAKKIAYIILCLLFLFIGAFLTIDGFFEKRAKACFQDTCFSLEVADTPDERQVGLMFRESLDDDKGMLFVFEKPGPYKFWMKNTLIPLDMVWLNGNFEVIYIEENTEPCQQEKCPSYGPDSLALYVLELNAGIVKKLGMRAGDAVKLRGI